MMKVTVIPGKPLRGEIEVPGDKSISHRAALLAGLADGDSQIHNFLTAGVTKVMLNALTELGIGFEIEASTLVVHGKGPGALRAPLKPVDCGNSATTLRLLTGFLAATGIPAVLDGSAGLRKRPMQRIVDPLKAMGVPIHATQDGTAPLILEARSKNNKLHAIDYRMPISSAQVKSTLLFASLAADGPCQIHEPGPSRDHTELMLQSLGVQVSTYQEEGVIPGSRTITLIPSETINFHPFAMNIPGDISSAAFFMVGAAIAEGSQIKILNVGINPTRTGLIDAMCKMGADFQISNRRVIQGEPLGDLTIAPSELVGTEIKGQLVVRMIDEFPAITTASVFANGTTTVLEAEELRHKESDRISALVEEFARLGVNIEEKPDGFVVHGVGHLSGGLVNAHGDHRIVMALTIAGLSADNPLTVKGAEVVSESYPGYYETLSRLGASLSIEPE